jgi:hypothetical protein
MASIKNINQKIFELKTIVDGYLINLQQDRTNYSLQITIDNIKGQIEELQHILYQENLKREKEILQLRLIGKVAKNGTFPLSLVGGITNSFSSAVLQTSKYLQFGNKGGKRIEKIINETIDLKLEGIGKGSTIFYLSANTSPDLFGNSTIQTSLNNIFELLNSDNQEKLIDSIPTVGTNSIRYYSDFFKELTNDELEIDLSWHSPNEEIKQWNGSKKRVLELYNSLNSLQLDEPEEINFEGEIITLSMKSKFEILSVDKERFYGNFPSTLTEAIQQLHIGQFCKGTILKTAIVNPVTNRTKYEYSLTQIEGK